jgi:hypothetical protein
MQFSGLRRRVFIALLGVRRRRHGLTAIPVGGGRITLHSGVNQLSEHGERIVVRGAQISNREVSGK